MSSLKDFLFHPIANTFGHAIGSLVHIKSSAFMAPKIKHLRGLHGDLAGWENELCTNGDIKLRGVSYTPAGYNDKNGVIICFWGNGDFYQTNTATMQKLALATNKKVVSYNNRGVINSGSKAPISELDIIDDAVAISIKHINDKNRDNSCLYGHSLGGAQAVKTGYQLLKSRRPVKVYSWNSLRSISAVVREMILIRKIAKPLNAIIGTALGILLGTVGTYLLPITGINILTLGLGSLIISSGLAMFTTIEANKKFLDKAILSPLLKLAGWNLNCEQEGKHLLEAGLLHYGNMKSDGVIRTNAQFADCMDPYLNELERKIEDQFIKDNKTLPEGTNFYLNTRYLGTEHMLQPVNHEQANKDMIEFMTKPRRFTI